MSGWSEKRMLRVVLRWFETGVGKILSGRSGRRVVMKFLFPVGIVLNPIRLVLGCCEIFSLTCCWFVSERCRGNWVWTFVLDCPFPAG